MKHLLILFTLGVGIIANSQRSNASLLERFDAPSTHIVLSEVRYNASGVTFNPDTQSYFVIQNNTGFIFEYDISFSKLLRKIQMLNLVDDDTEDIVYLGNQEFAIANESNQVFIFKLAPGQTRLDLDSSLSSVQVLQLPKAGKKNNGVEGICYGKNIFYAVQEKKPKKVYKFSRPSSKDDLMSPGSFGVREPFNTDAVMKHRLSDLSGCFVDPITMNLLVLSHESSRIMEVSSAGKIIDMLDLPRFPEQFEGITIGAEGELVLLSEPNIISIFKPKR